MGDTGLDGRHLQDISFMNASISLSGIQAEQDRIWGRPDCEGRSGEGMTFSARALSKRASGADPFALGCRTPPSGDDVAALRGRSCDRKSLKVYASHKDCFCWWQISVRRASSLDLSFDH